MREATLKHRRRLASGEWDETIESRPIADHRAGLELILEVAGRHPAAGEDSPGDVYGFGHRVVHGGEVFCAVDGVEPFALQNGDRVVVRRAEFITRLIILDHATFYRKVRNRYLYGERLNE